MATYLSPGVYVKEVDAGPKPIAGLPTSVGALIGATERGPLMDPTRLGSWNDYGARFGGSIEGSYTAEAAFGFFQNGGTALWVTRADNATLSRWRVRDGLNAESFFVEAESPGAWSARMRIALSRETGGGQGLVYAARITGPGASVNLGNGRSEPVAVESTAGAAVGMLVVVDDTTANGPVEATIEAIGTGQLTLATPATGPGRTMQITADPHVSARFETGATSVELVSGSGFQAGDMILAVPPDGTPQGAAVQSATAAGTGVHLALATPFGADVPGIDFAQRTFVVAATILPATDANVERVPLTRISGAPGLVGGDMVRLVTASGMSANWSTGTTRFDFATGFDPVGPAQVVARLGVAPYTEQITLTVPAGASAAEINTLLGPFNFVPEGARLTLAKAGGATVDFTRTATGWTAPASFDGDYVQATVTPTGAQGLDVTRGIVVKAVRAPAADDYVDFGGSVNLRRIKAVLQPTGTPPDVFVLQFASAFPANPPVPTQPTGAPKWPLMAWQPTRVQTLRFGISATLPVDGGPPVVETFAELSLNPAHPRYYLHEGIVNGLSRLISVTPRTASTALTSADSLPAAVAQSQAGGAGTLTVGGIRAALQELERASEPALLAAPDVLTLGDDMQMSAAYGELILHAEDFRRFAVIDLPQKDDDVDLLEWRMLHLHSTYAASYAPFLRILNPRGPGAIDVPPSGFVMGVYARTDNKRGVWKAPANEDVKGIVGLATEYTQRRQDLLNPRGVNLVRQFPRGTLVWGARNVTDDTTWRYVNVRRLFLMLENAIDAGTQWTVFEPNTATTWLRARVSVENFLNQVWRAGGLAGSDPTQAYRVSCGLGTTMTETDIELGLLIIEVAVAPAFPAEFVVFQISHKRLAE